MFGFDESVMRIEQELDEQAMNAPAPRGGIFLGEAYPSESPSHSNDKAAQTVPNQENPPLGIVTRRSLADIDGP